MAHMYKDYERLYESRRKSNDYKPILAVCKLTEEDDKFAVRYKDNNELLYTITPDNVVTLHNSGQTMRSRRLMGLAVNTPIYSDTAGNRNKLHTIRMHVRGGSVPYMPGIQVRLNSFCRDSHQFSNTPVDMTRTVTNEAKNHVKDETAKIRKLVKVMTRLGVFDEIARKRLGNWGTGVQDDISKVNYNDPVGQDAERVFLVGLNRCDTPTRSGFVNGVWVQKSEEERLAVYKDRAVEAGLRALRKHIYATKEGSYVITPVRCKTD